MHWIASCATLVVALSACPPSPVTPPRDADADVVMPDASAADLAAACDNLATLGCDEGVRDAGAPCLVVLTHVQTTRITSIDVACAAAAHSKEEARRCRGILCP